MDASMVDIREVERNLGSYKFTVPTRQIISLKNQVEEWISLNSCGAIIYGNSRSGKTSAIGFISESLKKTYGAQLPVYVYCATEHTHTDKTFYSSLLVALGHEMAHKGTAVQMRQRLVNRIITNAMDTKYHRAILYVDEAYLLTEKEYVWLIDIYNELHKSGVDLAVFLVGTKELKEQKEGFIRASKQQIVLRFMVFEFKFKGLESRGDVEICLSSLDNPLDVIGMQELVILSELYFPMAYHD
jgi:Cdc6-like AAA superfamily ATPase